MTEQNDVEILYRDEALVAVNKPAGMLVHPHRSKRSPRRTLMSVVRDQLGQYVYPVHRLDKPVSGVTIFGLDGKVVRTLKQNWHSDETIKEYLALCFGHPPDEGRWDDPLKNHRQVKQQALTEFRCLHQFGETSLVKVRIHTGRKHQIRRHFALHGFELVGDTEYGKEKKNAAFREQTSQKGIFLHGSHLSFVHPHELKKVSINAPLPEERKRTLVLLSEKGEGLLRDLEEL